MQFDPDRFIGEIVQLDSTYNSEPTHYFRIIRISHENTGKAMSVDLVRVNDIPARSDMFIIGTSYLSGTTKELSY